MPFLLLVKSHALFPNSEKYVVEIRLSPFIVVTSKVTPIFARNFLPPLKRIKVHIISDYGDAMSLWDVLLFLQLGNFHYMDGPLTFSRKPPV